MKKLFNTLVLLTVLSLVLSACGGAPSSGIPECRCDLGQTTCTCNLVNPAIVEPTLDLGESQIKTQVASQLQTPEGYRVETLVPTIPPPTQATEQVGQIYYTATPIPTSSPIPTQLGYLEKSTQPAQVTPQITPVANKAANDGSVAEEIWQSWQKYSFVTPIYGNNMKIEGFVIDGSRTTIEEVNKMVREYIKVLHKHGTPVMLEVGYGTNPNPIPNYGYIGITLDSTAGLIMPDRLENLPLMAFFKGVDITLIQPGNAEPVELIFSNRPFPQSGGNASYNLDVQLVHETKLLKSGGHLVIAGQTLTFDQHFNAALNKYASDVSPYTTPPTRHLAEQGDNGSTVYADFQDGSTAIYGEQHLIAGIYKDSAGFVEDLLTKINTAFESAKEPLVLIFHKK